jgi:hypothetical protein
METERYSSRRRQEAESESNYRETERESRGSARVQRDRKRELKQVDGNGDDCSILTVGAHECTTMGVGRFVDGVGTGVWDLKSGGAWVWVSGRVFGKHPHIPQQKIHGTVSFGSKYSAKDTPTGLKNVILQFLFYPSLYPQQESSEQEKKFLNNQFLNETSHFSILNGIFFSYPQQERSK